MSNSFPNTHRVRYIITGKQRAEWGSVLACRISRTFITGWSSASPAPVCVAACPTGFSFSCWKLFSVKTFSRGSDSRSPASMGLLCARPSEPRSGCRGMCISPVPRESQIHLRCPPLPPPPPPPRCLILKDKDQFSQPFLPHLMR